MRQETGNHFGIFRIHDLCPMLTSIVGRMNSVVQASPSKGKGQDPQTAPPTPAAAAVLGQTGLWGRLMGGPDNTKAPQEETESTDGEDEVPTPFLTFCILSRWQFRPSCPCLPFASSRGAF